MVTAGVQHAHKTPLRITYNYCLPLCSHELGQLSNGRRPTERGRSSVPLLPLELGSGAQVVLQIHKEYYHVHERTESQPWTMPFSRHIPPMGGDGRN